MEASDTHRTIETVYRMERARLIAGLARMLRDVGLAEELAQDALVSALSDWPKNGIPANPGAWLMAAAKRRGIDQLRRRRMIDRKHAEIGRDLEEERFDAFGEIEAKMDDDIGDERLSLIFTACHPALSTDARVALTLRLIGGLTTGEIARAFLSSEQTIAQRIVRAKKALGNAGIAYEVPRGEQRESRLASVLEVVYLIFNEGYAASSGEDAIRPQLSHEAMRLGRILAALAPDEPEAHGLLALMEIQASRLPARIGADGMPVPLTRQNRARWDRLLLHRGLASLERAEHLGGANGVYALQAAVAACHARAARYEDTDWMRIATLYDRLLNAWPSPVVGLNRAIAHSMAFGAETGLVLLAELESEPALKDYAPLHAARGDFLQRVGRRPEAKAAFERAAALSGNEQERAFLLARAAGGG
ncbi:RNA polymerase sigma factor [Rhizobium cremeum]|uniref:RNA polymerase sigma factor n=1 Tax=Rhizobium cremeum TaxID=2813827 RepID=UPI001FD1CFF0|nr:RNA polymerase sigma factor [Rhizobium cremeum]MCJ7996590.1 RNA polymerase sigma factor [Rhizobium cremeum]MCJ7999314.1 RNA polymerase sigma factor [Rhizobium cremeum]